MRFTVEQLIEAVEVNFNAENIEQFESCIICDFAADDWESDLQQVRIVLVPSEREYKSACGIHLRQLDDESDLIHHIGDALNECFRSGFTNIWVHQKGA